MLSIILSIIAIIVSIINLFFLVIACFAFSKLLKSLEEPIVPVRDNLLDVPNNQSYDQAVLRGEVDPFSDGLSQRSGGVGNWDGISARR